MKTKITPSVILALLWQALPIVTQAQFTFVTNGDDTITITGYTGSNRNVIIPSTTNGYPVTTVGDWAFKYNSSLTNIIIPDSVTSIGSSAFHSCSGLTYVTIPDSVTSIGDWAFEFCSGLTNVIIGNSVTSVGNGAFEYCSGLTNVTIGNSVTSIGSGAFEYCSGLTNMTIPNSVTSIGVSAFADCSGLMSVKFSDSVTNIANGAFADCSGLTSVTIPDSVTSIGYFAFENCSGLTNITVNAANPSYASAGGVLFNKALTLLIQFPGGLAGSYALPDSVISIGDSAFGGCSGLTNVTISKGLTSIGSRAFKYCSGLTDVTISDSVTNIGRYAFLYCMHLRHVHFQGNAPRVDGGVGSEDTTVFYLAGGTVYYVPGSAGWGATFGGRPTAWWYQPQPQILGSAYGLGVQSKGFQFTISWATNAAVVVEASINLQNWTPVITNMLVNGTNAFWESDWTHHPQRFYRVRSQ